MENSKGLSIEPCGTICNISRLVESVTIESAKYKQIIKKEKQLKNTNPLKHFNFLIINLKRV